MLAMQTDEQRHNIKNAIIEGDRLIHILVQQRRRRYSFPTGRYAKGEASYNPNIPPLNSQYKIQWRTYGVKVKSLI